MARLTEDSDSDLPSLDELLQPTKVKIPLQPTAGNVPTPSPRKRTTTTKGDTTDFRINANEATNGQNSPVKTTGSPVRSRLTGTGRQQRSLKLPRADSLLLSDAPRFGHKKGDDAGTGAKTRNSPKRRAKQGVDYTTNLEEAEHESLTETREALGGQTARHRHRDDEESRCPEAGKRDEGDSLIDGLRSLAIQKPKLSSPRKKEPEVIDLTGSPSEGCADLPKSPTKKPMDFRGRVSPTPPSSDNDFLGTTLRFSPPLLKSPRNRPPVDILPQRPHTPPASPTKSKLVSPTKRPPALAKPPPTHHRPNLDAFWSQDEINTWTDTYSPKKILASPRKPRSYSLESSDAGSPIYSPTASPRKTTTAENPSKKQAAAAAEKAFDSRKHQTAETFFNELDDRLAKGEIKRLAESAGGVKIIWSKKLNSTAGRANWRREAIKRLDASTNTFTTTGYRHIASIELAEKVIDDEHRLHNVLAHEYCHLANFMISRVLANPHGSSFRSWALKATAAFGKSHGVGVTTKHDYAIKYKYLWVCSSSDRPGQSSDDGCGTEYARHSKSIDPARHTCGKCRGRLIQVRPKPRGDAPKPGSGVNAAKNVTGGKATGTGTAYQRFVKEQFQAIRQDLPPGSPMKDVMKEVGARYRINKEQPGKTEEIVETIEIADDEEVENANDASTDAEEASGKDVDSVARVLDFMTLSEK